MSEHSPLRVFVTGATGFIGIHLCRALTVRGDDVVAMVRSAKKASRLPDVEIFEGDLSCFADPKTVLPTCDVVVHLAGVVAADTPEEYEAVNFVAVKNLVECIGRQSFKPRRLLFASSLAAAGPSPADRAWTEDDEVHPVEDYGVAKARAETVVRTASFPTTIFRPPIVLGPGDDASLTLFRMARSRLGFRAAGKPQELSFVDVRDLVDAILLMIDDPRSGSFTYFTSHPEQTDVAALWNELGRAVGARVAVLVTPKWMLYATSRIVTALSGIFGFKNQLDEKQYLQLTAPAFVCSSDRLRRELGWDPRFDLPACLSHAAEGYRAAGLLRP